MLEKYGVCKNIIRETKSEKPRQNEGKWTSGCKRQAMDRDEWGALRLEINWINILTDRKKAPGAIQDSALLSLLYRINKKVVRLKV